MEVTQRYPPALGGVEIQVEAQARALVALGHAVEVVTTDLARDRPFARLSRVAIRGPIPVRRHRAFRTIPAPHGLGIVAPGMAADLLRARADVVHAHAFGMAPTWMAAGAHRVRRVPLVIETHADAGRGTSGWRTYARAIARLTLRPADRVVAHTQLEADLLVSLGVAAERVAVIPNGIDLTEFERSPPRVSSTDGVTVLFLGRLYPEQKGLEPLVRALAQVPRRLGFRVRLVGEDWGGRALVMRRAKELGVADRITLTGPLARDDVLREYARADLFVLPSLFDCTPVVLLEAMAAGLPIVASRVGGIPEVVGEGENALLCAPNDPVALANALGRLGSDEAMRTRFARAGRERVERFSWTRVVPERVALFETVIENRP